MKPYYSEAGIEIWHGDCRDVVWHALIDKRPDVIVTDPPYGINGASNSLISGKSKGDYDTQAFEDSPEYVSDVIVPALADMRHVVHRAVLTPG